MINNIERPTLKGGQLVKEGEFPFIYKIIFSIFCIISILIILAVLII